MTHNDRMAREQDEQADATSAGAGGSQGGQGEPAPRQAGQQGSGTRIRSRTRTSAMWLMTLVGLVVLAFLLVFILQNLTSTKVAFLGFSGSLPLAVAMLFSAIGGAGFVGLLGTARMIQLRRAARRGRGAKH